MKRRYFGTDGIRGRVDGPLLAPGFVRRLGLALGKAVGTAAPSGAPAHRADVGTAAPSGTPGAGRAPIVVVGRDTRASGVALTGWLAEGLEARGVVVLDLGVVPTPAVAMRVRELGADLGVVLTASHNPASDNGIKLFGADGFKLADATEAAIEAAIDAEAEPAPRAVTRLALEEGATRYRAAMQAMLPEGSLRGWKIVVDAAHGATAATTPAVLRALGAEVVTLGDLPDGSNINEGVGSEHPEAMIAAVKSHGARLGIAHDGDGDRLVLADERGELVDGDALLALLALDALARGRLAHRTLVATVMSNLALDELIEQAGGRVVRTAVGDRYVIEAMREGGFTLGGENSGHVVIGDRSSTGDGFLAALAVIDVVLRTGKPLSELAGVLRPFPQAKANLTVPAKPPIESLPGLVAEIAEVERVLGRGRVLVRYSGTEPKIRVLVEAAGMPAAEAAVARLVAAIRREIG